VNIPAGVTGLTAGGAPLTQITIVPLTTDLPALPSDGAAVGVYFDIQSQRVYFQQPDNDYGVFMKPSLIPTGTSPYLAWYNPATGQWEQLTTVSIDTVNHTITASVNHFSTFAVLALCLKPVLPLPPQLGLPRIIQTQRQRFRPPRRTIG